MNTYMARNKKAATPLEQLAVARLLGETIQAYRTDKGWSPEKLAGEAGLSLSTVRRAEAGNALPDWETLDRFSKALGRSLQDVLAALVDRFATQPIHPLLGSRSHQPKLAAVPH